MARDAAGICVAASRPIAAIRARGARRRGRRARAEDRGLINYRVDDLTALLAQLKRNGVEVVKGPDSEENGEFAWLMDPDGNKVELWEPMTWDEKNKKA